MLYKISKLISVSILIGNPPNVSREIGFEAKSKIDKIVQKGIGRYYLCLPILSR